MAQAALVGTRHLGLMPLCKRERVTLTRSAQNNQNICASNSSFSSSSSPSALIPQRCLAGAQLSCSQPMHQLLLDVLRTPSLSSLAAVQAAAGSVGPRSGRTGGVHCHTAASAATRPAHAAPIATPPASLTGCFYSSSSKA